MYTSRQPDDKYKLLETEKVDDDDKPTPNKKESMVQPD
jgi:hypothetical protein